MFEFLVLERWRLESFRVKIYRSVFFNFEFQIDSPSFWKNYLSIKTRMKWSNRSNRSGGVDIHTYSRIINIWSFSSHNHKSQSVFLISRYLKNFSEYVEWLYSGAYFIYIWGMKQQPSKKFSCSELKGKMVRVKLHLKVNVFWEIF